MHSKEKIKKIRERALLREYIYLRLSTVIKEQDDYGDYYDDPTAGMGGGGYGGDPSGQNVLRLFGIDTILDSLKTAQYAVESTLNKAVGETKLLLKNFIYFAIPFIINKETPNLIDMADKDREKVKQRLQEIDRKYGDVLKKNSLEAILNNADFKVAAFLASPGLFLAKPLVEKSIGAISSTIDAIIPPERNREDLFEMFGKLFGEHNVKPGQTNRMTEEQFRALLAAEIARDPNLAALIGGATANDVNTILTPRSSNPTSPTKVPSPVPTPPTPSTTLKENIQEQPQPQQINLQTDTGKQFVESLKRYIAFLKNPNAIAQAINNSPLAADMQNVLGDTIQQFVAATINDINTKLTPEAIKNKIMQNKESIKNEISKRFKDVPEINLDSKEFKTEAATLRNNYIDVNINRLEDFGTQSNSQGLKAKIDAAIKQLAALKS